MKKILAFIFVLGLFSCKKTIEKIQEDIVISAMVNGQWKMASFMEDSYDRTAEFQDYAFQFKEANTVDAIKNGVLEKTGSWSADPPNKTLTSQFNTLNNPLILLNGTWKITGNSWTHVDAKMEIGGVTWSLRIEKI